MEAKAAGRIFWTFFLLLFRLAAQTSSAVCVNNKRRETCGLKDSSVEFPCAYPSGAEVISVQGWSRKLDPTSKSKLLEKMQSNNRGNDCTMRIRNLTEYDASIYYFRYKFRFATGDTAACNGVLEVRLHVVAFPLSIFVEKIVGRQNVPVTHSALREGESIRLTCVPTCAAKLSTIQGYIWYKDRVQINESKVNSPFLFLYSVSMKDSGNYRCGYKHLHSFIVSLRVQGGPKHKMTTPEIPNGGRKKDSELTLKTPKGKSLSTLSKMVSASVCFGWSITILVAILLFKAKRRRSAFSVPGTPDSNSDTTYMTMDINSMSHEYETLDTVRCFLTDEAVYENLHQPEN